MADELKPCPFCGGEARMFYVDGWARPRCKCGANSGVLAGSDAEAIAAWNRRPSPAVGESETSRTIDDATPAELAACTFAQAMADLTGEPQAVVNDAVRECIDAIHASPGVTAGASDAELIAKLREHATDWDGRQMPDLEPAKGDPTAGTLRESAARLASLSAEVERLIGYYAQVMSGQSVAIITRLETSERALAAEREARERDVRELASKGNQ